MAVTITQQPTTPNVAYTRLPFVVSGSANISQPQFQYVMDVYVSGSANKITRVTQTVNEEGAAIFDPSIITQGELSYGNYWTATITGSIFGNPIRDVNKEFIFKFGEQYGTSISSSITVYPDITSSSLLLFPGVWGGDNPEDRQITLQPINGTNPYTINFNFPSSSFLLSDDSSVTNFINTDNWYSDQALTDDPYKLGAGKAYSEIRENYVLKTVGPWDYETNTYFQKWNNTHFQGQSGIIDVYSGSTFIGTAASPAVYDSGSVFKSGPELSVIGMGPKNIKDWLTTATTYTGSAAWSAIYHDEYTHYNFKVANKASGSISYDNNWFFNELYSCDPNIRSVDSAPLKNGYFQTPLQNLNFSLPYVVENIKNNLDKVRFAFINRYGVYDYYNCYQPVTTLQNIEREIDTLSRIDYSKNVFNYTTTKNGEKQSVTESYKGFSITTDWLDKPTANWLEQLIESPEVYIQTQVQEFNYIPYGLFPIIITNVTYRNNNETARNKLFQYTIEFITATKVFDNFLPNQTAYFSNPKRYYRLTKCGDNTNTWRTDQDIFELFLNTNDRVTTGTATYVVSGVIQDIPSITNVGTVTPTGLTGCPAITRYTLTKCEDHTNIDVDANGYALTVGTVVQYLSGSSYYCGIVNTIHVTGTSPYPITALPAHCSDTSLCPPHYVQFNSIITSSQYNGEELGFGIFEQDYTPPFQAGSESPWFSGPAPVSFSGSYTITDTFQVTALPPTSTWSTDFRIPQSQQGHFAFEGIILNYTNLEVDGVRVNVVPITASIDTRLPYAFCGNGYSGTHFDWVGNYTNALTGSKIMTWLPQPLNYNLQQCSTGRCDIYSTQKDLYVSTFSIGERVSSPTYGECVVIGQGYSSEGGVSGGTISSLSATGCSTPFTPPSPSPGPGYYAYLASAPQQQGALSSRGASAGFLNTTVYSAQNSVSSATINSRVWYTNTGLTVPFQGGGLWYSLGAVGDPTGSYNCQVSDSGVVSNRNTCDWN